MNLPCFFQKIVFLTALLPFAVQAQDNRSFGEISGKEASPAALAAFLQQAGILGNEFTFSPADAGFAVDTARPRHICCDAVFMELLRSRLTPEELVAATQMTARRTPVLLDSNTAHQAVLYTPFTAGNLTFVLVENPAPGSRSASLVVLKNEGRTFTVVEKSPLCRARRSAADSCRK